MGGSSFSQNSKITASVVFLLISAAISWGIMYQKVNNLEDRMVRVENKLDKIIESRITLK